MEILELEKTILGNISLFNLLRFFLCGVVDDQKGGNLMCFICLLLLDRMNYCFEYKKTQKLYRRIYNKEFRRYIRKVMGPLEINSINLEYTLLRLIHFDH